MTSRRTTVAALATLCLAMLAGCASLDPEPSFRSVQQDILARSGEHVAWSRPELENVRDMPQEEITALAGDGLTLEEAVQITLASGRVQARLDELDLAQAGVVQATLLENPIFAGKYQLVEDVGHIWELEVAQSVTSLLLMPLRRSAAKADQVAVERIVTAEVLQVIAEVKAAYYEAQAAHTMAGIWSKELHAAAMAHEMAKRIREAGNNTELELLLRRAAHEEARLGMAEAELAAVEAKENANRVICLWGRAADWQPQTELPPPPDTLDDEALGEAESLAVRSSLDLSMLRAEMEALASEAGIANVSSVLPGIEAGAIMEKEAGESQWNPGPIWAVEVPLFDFGQADRRKAEVRLRQAWREYEALAADIRSAARTLRARMDTAHAKARYFDEVINPLMEKITSQAQLRYNGMFLGVFQLLETKRAELAAARRRVMARRDYWLAKTDMDLLLSGVLPSVAPMAMGAPAGDMQPGGGH